MRNQLPGSSPASASPYADATDSPHWEYMIKVLPAKKMNDANYVDPLNGFGRDGWEMVSMTPYDTVVSQMVYAFKRPRRR